MAYSPKIQALAEQMQICVDDVLTLWKDGMKATIVVRNPKNPEQDFVIGNDSLDGAIDALTRCKGRVVPG